MANQRLNARIEIGASVDRSVGRALGGIQSSLKKVGQEIRDVERSQDALGRQRDVLVKQGKSVDDLDREYAELGRTLDQLKAKQARYDRVMLAGRRVGETAKEAGREIGRSMRNLALGATAAGAAVIGLTNSVAASGREIGRMSALANSTPREFQRWAAGAATVGIEQDKLADILKDVNDRVGDFIQTGGGPMADFFENVAPKVGVTAEMFRELSGPEALQLYVESLEKAGLNHQDMTFYLEAMASDATALIPLLRRGGSEMNRLGDEAERVGAILSDDAVEGAADYTAAMREMRQAGMGLRNTIGTALMPAVTRLARTFAGWVGSNRGQVEAWSNAAAGAVERVLPVIGEVVAGFGRVSEVVGDAASVAADAVGGWENLGSILAAAFAARTIGRVASFGWSVGRLGVALGGLVTAAPMVRGAMLMIGGAVRALGMSLLFNPIGLAVAAIAGGALLIIRNWETIRPKLQPVFDWFGRTADNLAAGWQTFKDDMAHLLEGLVRAFEWAKERIGAVVEWFKEKGQQVAEIGTSIKDWASGEKGKYEYGPGGMVTVKEPSDITRRAVGGAYDEGPLLVGEGGAELMYPSRAGFIAHARHTRRLVSLEREAARLRPRAAVRAPVGRPALGAAVRAPAVRPAAVVDRRAGDAGAMFRALAREVSASPAPRAVVDRPAPASADGGQQRSQLINVTINQAPGQSADALLRELERRLSRHGGALFDRVSA